MNLNEFQGAKILIVDDEPTNLRVLYNLLKQYPFKLLTVQNSLSVIELIEKETPDLILLDIMMPGINGFDLCRQIKAREEFKDISIIFISALNDIPNIVKGFELGAVDYIPKPFQNEEVLARLNNHLTIQYQAKRLKEKNEELMELNLMKNKFFSIIAHDVKNPFTGILGISEMLKYEFDNLEQNQLREMLEHLYVSSKRCFKLLENLLQWANSQLNNLVVSPARHNLLEHINSIVENFQLQAEQKKITIHSKIDSSLFYYADKNLIDTVLRNLLNNAIKFTPEKGSVEISAQNLGDKLEIKVKDTGIGIPNELKEKLFKIGSKVTRLGTKKEDGTGLGLILSYEFLKKANGNIRVESEVGKGTEFIIELPSSES